MENAVIQQANIICAISPLLDRENITKTALAELTREMSIWSGQVTSIQNNENHVPWNSAESTSTYGYWARQHAYLQKKLPPQVLDELDASSTHVLELTENPKRQDPFDRRGLVVGHVQSGKTSHYCAVIAKFIDSGGRIVIVLSGAHNELRLQTQSRIEEAITGFNSEPLHPEQVGVGIIDPSQDRRPKVGTYRHIDEDFEPSKMGNMGASPSESPWIFVVKKHPKVLAKLHKCLAVLATRTPQGMKIEHPVLIIDDEADHYSVDTKDGAINHDGSANNDHTATAVNRSIRSLLHSFSKSAFVGYTATPFANIFIHRENFTDRLGPDLFPKSFIVNLSAPSNYIGPTLLFGAGGREPLPLLREMSDFVEADGKSGWMPPSHDNDHKPLHKGANDIPSSLKNAIDSFLLSCAARLARNGLGAHPHCSMLIHVTRLNKIQSAVTSQVDKYVKILSGSLRSSRLMGPTLARLKTLWQEDFEPTTLAMAQAGHACAAPIAWEEIEKRIEQALEHIIVKKINGKSIDALDYANHPNGLFAIAIGGDKLSRGLTLEGLCSSYFIRPSKTYDSLMQMGRWFGYRDGYSDLCRLWTTPELSAYFKHVADSCDEMRELFDEMQAAGATPDRFGLRVAAHDKMKITAANKMRHAHLARGDHSKSISETITLPTDAPTANANFNAATDLIARLGAPDATHPRFTSDSGTNTLHGFTWTKVNPDHIENYLAANRTDPNATTVDSDLLLDHIKRARAQGLYGNWTVALAGSSEGPPLSLPSLPTTLGMARRARKPGSSNLGPYVMRRLVNPIDEAHGLDADQYKRAMHATLARHTPDPARDGPVARKPTIPSGTQLRVQRSSSADGTLVETANPLLIIYPLDPSEAKGIDPSIKALTGFAISFPDLRGNTMKSYHVDHYSKETQHERS